MLVGQDGRVSVILITGIQAAGKSTVAQALAESLPNSVHVRGDLFRRMIVNGRVDMGPAVPDPRALEQLRLRYELAAETADRYAQAGFTVVLQDIILGEALREMTERIASRPLSLVVLAPSAAAVRARDAERRGGARQGRLQARRRGDRRARPRAAARDAAPGLLARHLGAERRPDRGRHSGSARRRGPHCIARSTTGSATLGVCVRPPSRPRAGCARRSCAPSRA